MKIKKAQIIGNVMKYSENLYLTKPGTLTFSVEYFNAGRPVRAFVYQQIGEEKRYVKVLFGKDATYKLDLKKEITKPEKLPVIADVRRRRWKSDSHFETTVTFGIADNRPKPINTYPEKGVENEVLDIRPEWRVGADIYPKPTPTDITISPKDVQFTSNVVVWDIPYKIGKPEMKFEYSVTNRSDRVLSIEEWTLMVSVLYEDFRHMSYISTKIGYPVRRLNVGETTNYSFKIELPDWSYGYVSVTHACKYYKDGMFVYGGGPLWNFMIGRILFPE